MLVDTKIDTNYNTAVQLVSLRHSTRQLYLVLQVKTTLIKLFRFA